MRINRSPFIGVALLVTLIIAAACGGGESASFTGLGDTSEGFTSVARGVSGNGLRVVGGPDQIGSEGFRWFSGKMSSVDDFDGGAVRGWAADSNFNGNATVGASEYEPGKVQGYLYLEPIAASIDFSTPRFIELGFLEDGTESVATAVSDDIEVIVGFGESASGTQAFRYTSTGKMAPLGFLSGGSEFSAAYALSLKGRTIVGESQSERGVEAFIWNRADKMVSLGTLSDTPHDVARAISTDATIVGGGVATDSSGEGREAFLWTQASGFQLLGDLTGGDFNSTVNALSANGKVAVGTASTGSGEEAFIWDAALGMRSLSSVLVDEFGLDLAGWRLESAVAISNDGQTIVGMGINPAGQVEGWVAVLPRDDIEAE